MQKIYSFLLLLALALGARAADPEVTLKGAGTEADPWQISTAADLVQLAEWCNNPTSSQRGHFKGKYFKLMADIDMATADDFLGIATSHRDQSAASTGTYYFSGVFDGAGHRIKNMTINGIALKNDGTLNTSTAKDGSRNYVGLFGLVHQSGQVMNVIIDKSCKVTGYTYVGGIAGYVGIDSKVINCVNEGEVTAYNSYAGGITGQLYRTGTQTENLIDGCVNSGTITTYGSRAGGIAGDSNFGKITNCANTGNIVACISPLKANGTFDQLGGIVGHVSAGTTENVFNSGNILQDMTGTTSTSSTKGYYVGGIIGDAQTGTASGKTLGSLTNAVSIGNVQSTTIKFKGMVCGRNGSTATNMITFENVYYDAQMNAVTGAVGGDNDKGVSKLTTAEMTAGTAFSGFASEGWTFAKGFYPYMTKAGDAAKTVAATYFTLPAKVMADNFTGEATISTAMTGITARIAGTGSIFKVQGGKIVAGTATEVANDTVVLTNGTYEARIPVMQLPKLWEGDGTKEKPYLIKTKKDLMGLAEMCNGATMMHYEDTYFEMTADIDMEKDPEFIGIGTQKGVNTASAIYNFKGKFDGKNHTIKNLAIKAVAFNDKGAPQTAANGSASYVGLFGTLEAGAEIRNVILDETNRIEAYMHVGSIAGYAQEDVLIENCHSAATVVNHSSNTGGILGYNNGVKSIIRGCSFTGTVEANDNNAAGITSYNKGTVENCVNTGTIHAWYFSGAAGSTPSKTKFRYVAGIVGNLYQNATVQDCANYGVIMANGFMGGIVGSTSGASKIQRCFNSGQLMDINLSDAVTWTGSIAGQISGTTAVVTDNVFDSQVSTYNASNNQSLDGAAAMKTADLTSGNAIEAMKTGWTFAKNSYPVPTACAQIAGVQTAISTFMTQTGGNVNNFVGGDIAAPQTITAKLTVNNPVFKLSGKKLTTTAVSEVQRDTLTLTNGRFTAIYPLQKLPSVLPGSGTQADPYQIKTADDINKVAAFLADASYTFEDEYLALMNDIDYTGKELNPIGSSTVPFQGTFDGKNFTIKNISVTPGENKRNGNNALFHEIGKSGTVQNIRLSNVSIEGYSSSAGIAVGCRGKISNIYVDDKCSFKATYLNTTSGLNGLYAAGIVCQTYDGKAVIEKCENHAAISASQYAAGIVAYITTGNGGTLTDCKNYGNVTTNAPYRKISQGGGAPTNQCTEHYAAGIAGAWQGVMKNVENHGTILADKGQIAGGIVAKTWTKTDIDNALNTGNVTIGDTISALYAGGIVGIVANAECNLSNVENRGAIKAYSTAAGIAGQFYANGSLKNARNYGDVTVTKMRSGGLIGFVAGTKTQVLTVDSVYNVGKISGDNCVGGIFGHATNGVSKISHSFNAGELHAYVTKDVLSSVGGIGNGTIEATDCYNAADILGYDNVGGILGQPGADSKAVNCYNVGLLTTLKEDNKDNIGSIIGTERTGVEVTNCYALRVDTMAQAMNTLYKVEMLDYAGLTKTADKLGKAFKATDLAMPMLAGFDTVAAAKAYAAYFEIPPYLNQAFRLASLPGVVWTGNELFEISGNEAKGLKDGDNAELTATCGDFKRTYLVGKVEKFVGVDQITVEEVKDVKYFTTDGRQISEPARGEVTIAVYTMMSGKTTVKKMIRK